MCARVRARLRLGLVCSVWIVACSLTTLVRGSVADDDHSGFLEEDEGRTFLGMVKCTAAEVGKYWIHLVKTVDEDGDGKISKEEFLPYIMDDESDVDPETGQFRDFHRQLDIQRQIKLLGPGARLLGALFDAVDTDRSGYLEKEEGWVFLGVCGCDEAEIPYYWEDIVRTADEDGDGQISKEEFLTFLMEEEDVHPISGEFQYAERRQEIERQIRMLGPAAQVGPHCCLAVLRAPCPPGWLPFFSR